MKKLMLVVSSCLWISFYAFGDAAEPGTANPERRVEEARAMHWGMFVCWSFSTFSGKEWTPGVTNISLFNPTGCEVEQWVKSAKEAEMGYILFLTKHHDGFCLWDTKTTDRKVTRSPLGRDVLRELRAACDKHGLKLALYFSEGEWAWPNKPDGTRFQADGGYNPEMKQAQLRELLTQYGPIEFIWFDHAVGDGGLSHADTVKLVKSLQPACFVGFNHGAQEGADIRLGEMGRPGALADQAAAGPYMPGKAASTYRLAEFTYPIQPKHEGGAMWFYSLPKHDQLCLPPEQIYADFQGAVKYGNLFSLDVGPDYAGRLREIDVKTLRRVGQYIRGEAKPPAGAASSAVEQGEAGDACAQPSPEEMAKAAGVTLPHQPWHLANIWWEFEKPTEHFESLEVDVTIDRDVPATYNLYISPCGLARINGKDFYGGLQSNINGWANGTNHTRVHPGKGAIFSRWSSDKKTSVSLDNVRTAGPDCLVESAGYEGEFCSVRRPFAWTQGTYTYQIVKAGTEVADGQTNTWFTCRVKDPQGAVHEIGSLRFEGSDFTYWDRHSAFVEVYSTEKIPHAGIPKVNVTFGWPRLNGHEPGLKRAHAYYPSKTGPAAPDCAWIKADGQSVRVEIGPIFQRDEANRRHDLPLIHQGG